MNLSLLYCQHSILRHNVSKHADLLLQCSDIQHKTNKKWEHQTPVKNKKTKKTQYSNQIVSKTQSILEEERNKNYRWALAGLSP